jgi:hypothetical protein
LASRIAGLRANFDRRWWTVPSTDRPYIQDTNPSANMFFDRAASLRDSPNSLTASTVVPVMSSACTW